MPSMTSRNTSVSRKTSNENSKANPLDQIIERFDATIAAVFFGHTHKDEFEIAYSDYSNQNANTATMVAYIAPALTPTVRLTFLSANQY
jgi:hypothetical protein